MRSAESYMGGSAAVVAVVLLAVSVCLSVGCAKQAAPDGAKDGKEVAVARTEGDADQGEFRALLLRGSAGMAAGGWEEAVADLSNALAMEPGNKEVTFRLGTSLIQMAQYEEAVAMLEPLLEEGSMSSSLLNNIAWACLKASDPAVRNIRKALKYARQAVIEDYDDPNVWGTLAEVHYVANNHDAAFRAASIATWFALQSRADNLWEYSELLRRCSRAVSPLVTDGER